MVKEGVESSGGTGVPELEQALTEETHAVTTPAITIAPEVRGNLVMKFSEL
jgi:hypothetical protein